MKFTVMRTFMAALTIGLGLLTAPIAASADDNPSAVIDQIRASGVLKVPVMTGEEPGYIKDPATGQWSGFYYEFLGEIATQLGVKLEPVETTWGNLAADFQSNKIDIAIGVNPNPKRGLVVDYLWEPLFTDAWAVLTPPGKPVKTWAELNSPDKTVVVQKGSTMQVVAEALLPKAKITPVEDRGLALMELQAGRADGVVLSIFDALQITNQKIGNVSLPEPILRNPATLAVARKPGNAGYINFLTNWILQERSLGLAQGKLARSWEARGIDLSILPAGFSF
ncbi:MULTISPECIES: transporter substrate-binding domain-containing protein [Mesorhizobium]|jgi:polar amino acid transport system substrate-binding protein|uniref:ABC transporter substrate-binding protein n=2 Tax=Mesorhizobium TaxID=68287 RepID=A0A6M7UAD9_RHILI|nr:MULTISPECIES: transporter substrate-binding domain-containing protein [Mesorhizobium]KRB32564.1 ABC transporter substrate-binding protein [Mesorhizobium sp. Root172]MBZ9887363.1 transporter substrate-binding domain-containing protein [Mesorhizobium sp. BR1-1-3]OBQ71396.1 ABC transporter substrate-binding protein [Mesorhizobium loti]QKC73033.1 ABC transporter substrate-binding protein [Mesorhizobium loti]RUX69621.1 transporter substrate-binding domain-containing protein [Mesorhizobium sp. M7